MPQSCVRCARFLQGTCATICGNCLANGPFFDVTYALFPYEWPVDSLIVKLKFHHQLCYAQALGELLTHKIQTVWYAARPLPDIILPVPLHPKRLRERGFNQALEIARPAAKALNLTMDVHGVKRIKATPPQSELPARKRKQNIANAFSVNKNYTGKHLAILDDVITTGHTVMELSRVLKENGAKQIDVWCCARRG